MNQIQQAFEAEGGRFLTSPEVIGERLSHAETLFFDWDGVFNSGYKTDGSTLSGFHENDSMGINMLRFSLWLSTGKVPQAFVVTGQLNPSARYFTERESFDGLVFKCANKIEAFEKLSERFSLDKEKSIFFFDDILDLSLASEVGLSMMIHRKGMHQFHEFVQIKGYADYLSGNCGGENAIRECCELLIQLNGNYAEVLENRISFSAKYREYLELRNDRPTHILEA